MNEVNQEFFADIRRKHTNDGKSQILKDTYKNGA